ncbi:MAG: hypothetical protein KHY77_01615 [Butyricicoccus pullicaecorum]|nr:hypothetical protein [Butyricicoccus pullicaecorum]
MSSMGDGSTIFHLAQADPFAVQDVETVIMYHHIVPEETYKKVLQDRIAIEKVYQTLYDLRVRNGLGTKISGAEQVSFVFCCADGTEFEVQTTQVEAGTRISDAYITHQAVLPLWYECGVEPEQA